MRPEGGCRRFEEAISALIDGEDPGMDTDFLDSHLRRCVSCRQFREAANALQVRVRVRPAEPVPDHTDQILAAIEALPPASQKPAKKRIHSRLALVSGLILAAAAVSGWFADQAISQSTRPDRNLATITQIEGGTQTDAHYPGALVYPPGAAPVAKPSVTLTDTEDQSYDLTTATARRVTLVYFGYTHCPNLCPLNMALTAEAIRGLPPKERQEVTVVFITTDPSRDTGPVIQRWLDQFDTSLPAFVGLRGTPTEIHQAEQQVDMPLSYAETVDAAAKSYQVVHAAYVLVYSQDGIAHMQVDNTETPTDYTLTLEHLITHGYQTS